MLRALPVLLLVSACAAPQGHLIRGPVTTSSAPASCGTVTLRREALGARWGEFLRVRVDTEATVVGQARLDAPGRPAITRSFFASGHDLVIDGSWSNESLSVGSAVPRGSPLVVTLSDVTPASGDCRSLKLSVEQGALVPDIDEAAWLAQRPPAPAPTVVARSTPAKRTTPRTASDPSEWKSWDTDLDTSEWKPWPVPAHFTAPLVGSPLAKGIWLAWSAQSSRVRAAATRECKAAPESVEAVDTCLTRLRKTRRDDEAVVTTFFGAPIDAGEAGTAARLALALSTAFSLGWPLAESTHVSSPFGMRTHPTLGGTSLHTGVDLSVPIGTPVFATGAGVVARVGQTPVNGRFVVIDHGYGVTTAYLHNSKVLAVEGQTVTAGDTLALSGNTGRSTGPHVHYQLAFDHQPIDPMFFRPASLMVQRAGP